MSTDLSIVIPCKNEAESICKVLSDIHDAFMENSLPEIVIVDDGSTDGTSKVVQSDKATAVCLVRHDRSMGYGEAIKTGISHATKEFVCIMDGDGQHSAQDVKRLYECANSRRLVVGRRTDSGAGVRWLARMLLRRWSRTIGGMEIHDSNSGLMIFPRKIALRMLPFLPDSMAYSDSFKLLFHLLHMEVTEAPIQVRERLAGSSKNTIRDGFKTLISTFIMVVLINPTRVFIPLAIGMILLGAFWAVPFLLMNRGLTTVSVVLLLGGIIFLLFGLLFKVLACITRSLIMQGSQHSNQRPLHDNRN